jgi:hypothetical protein
MTTSSNRPRMNVSHRDTLGCGALSKMHQRFPAVSPASGRELGEREVHYCGCRLAQRIERQWLPEYRMTQTDQRKDERPQSKKRCRHPAGL